MTTLSTHHSANKRGRQSALATQQDTQPSITELHALLAEQQAQMATMTRRQAELEALVQRLSHLAEATSSEPIETFPEDVPGERVSAETDETPRACTITSRRSLLKWGGLGAAAVLAAAGTAGATGLSHATPAQAANGDALICGQTNTASSTTILNATSFYGLSVVQQTSGNVGLSAVGGTNSIGVYGICGGSSGYGVYGFSGNGYGIVGFSSSGIDIAAVGAGRIYQSQAGFTGAPTSGSYNAGEQIRDNAGDLYICVASGSPGAWRRVAAGTPGHSGSFNFLPEPIRLLDTRTGSPWNAGSQHTLQVTGVVVDGMSVPSGSVGVVGNVTVIGPTSSGDLRLFPGPALPPTSSINFAAGQTLANGVTVRFNGSGQIVFQVDMSSGATTNVLFDAVGYIL